MTYTLIGTGNMAWMLASRMTSGGHVCVGAWGRNTAELTKLCATYRLPQLGAKNQVHDGADACIIAVSDDAIAEVVQGLNFRSSTLIHTAGSVPMSVLNNHCVNSGVMWPIFALRKGSLPTHRQFPAIMEANTKQALIMVQGVAKAMCEVNYETNTAKRQALHLAAVIGSNFSNHLLATSIDLCEAQGLPRSLLQPLLFQTFTATRTQHPGELQTGPAKRHDLATIHQQLELLKDSPNHLQEIYELISKAIMEKYPLKGKA
ncbi:MAG: DUF2520 domain-containing protein [Chitinophagaceae bacterium]